MMLELEGTALLNEAVKTMGKGFEQLPEFDASVDMENLRTVLLEVAKRMQDNYPYPHPLYAGQMLKPPHPVARLAYMLSMWINPNNHALDGGRASSAMEREAVAQIASIFGWEAHLGHLCSGGTMANLEALWVSGRLNPGKTILASQLAHYTHERISAVLGIPFESISCDGSGRMSMQALKERLKRGDIGTVVVTIGTTATGAVDPLLKVLELRQEYGFRIHADAAYGGYYALVEELRPETRAVYTHLSEVDSLVVDPHKHGLQPYGCGCVIFKDPTVGRLYKHDSPYTYFTSSELHLGEISLECSRPGSSAVALWATHRLLPPVPGGAFAKDLAKCRTAALKLYELVEQSGRFLAGPPPELDIVVWAPKAGTASEASHLSDALFEAAAAENLHLAKANLPRYLFEDLWPGFQWDREHVTCLRSCLMKPEHLDWVDRIWETLTRATDKVLIDKSGGL